MMSETESFHAKSLRRGPFSVLARLVGTELTSLVRVPDAQNGY